MNIAVLLASVSRPITSSMNHTEGRLMSKHAPQLTPFFQSRAHTTGCVTPIIHYHSNYNPTANTDTCSLLHVNYPVVKHLLDTFTNSVHEIFA